MTSKHFFSLGMVGTGVAMVALAQGCGGSSPSATGTGATGGTASSPTSSTKATSSSTSMTGPTSGTGGAGGAGGAGAGGAPSPTPNTTPGTAIEVMINPMMPTTGVAQDTQTPDYFKFSGMKGERVLISAQAVSIVPNVMADENYIIDTVVTLYDVNMNEIAQDDDAWPRFDTDSALFVELPATGTYYYTIEDCNAAFGSGCNQPPNVTDFTYQTFVADVDMLTSKEFYAGTSQDGTTAKAVPLAYSVTKGAAAFDIVDGDAFTANQPQVFSFVPPSSVTAAKGTRLRAEFWLQPNGSKNGDGSLDTVSAWVTDSTGTTILAQADQVDYKDGDNFGDGPLQLSVPVTAGSTYYLFVQDDNKTPFPNDYYFFNHVVDYGNPLQTNATNISALTAQTLTVASGTTAYYVDGNIAAPAVKYWYEVDPPAMTTNVFVICGSARQGSGVQGFTVDVQAQAGATGTPATIIPAGTSTTEVPNADLILPSATAQKGFGIPAGTTKVFLVVSATGQSATVTDTSYQCAVAYN